MESYIKLNSLLCCRFLQFISQQTVATFGSSIHPTGCRSEKCVKLDQSNFPALMLLSIDDRLAKI